MLGSKSSITGKDLQGTFRTYFYHIEVGPVCCFKLKGMMVMHVSGVGLERRGGDSLFGGIGTVETKIQILSKNRIC